MTCEGMFMASSRVKDEWTFGKFSASTGPLSQPRV